MIIPRTKAIKQFKAILPEIQLKKLKGQRVVAARLAKIFKRAVTDQELEYLGYTVEARLCTSHDTEFYAVGYKNGNVWDILTVFGVAEYKEITEKLRGVPMVTALIGSNVHTSG